jgi:hypothetical protein
MIKIDQIASLFAEPLFDLADDPGRAVADRVNARIRSEPRPNRAGQKLPSGGFDAALDRAAIDRRSAPLGMREGNLGLSPSQRLPLRLSFWVASDATTGIMPPPVWATICLCTPGASGKSGRTRSESKTARAWPSVILWIVLSPISNP